MTDKENDLIEKVVMWGRRLQAIPMMLIVLIFFGLIVHSAWQRGCTLPQVLTHMVESNQSGEESC